MASIRQLCPQCCWIHNGQLIDQGDTEETLANYIQSTLRLPTGANVPSTASRSGTGRLRIRRIRFENADGDTLTTVQNGTDVTIAMDCEAAADEHFTSVVASLALLDDHDNYIWLVRSSFTREYFSFTGSTTIRCHIHDLNVAQGTYRGVTFLSERDNEILDNVRNAFTLTVVSGDFFGTGDQGLPTRCKTLTRSTWTHS
ncbi:Wzt carbohydrate-binding domain-containing protein [Rubinisphaera sp. JC750]|uniref:Wzt carbohydrate-binding domain-containing protein n=1 Tax=Rubinisphaera sp. JC750 TaxID=2898658 RepID=UPI003965824A